MQNNVDNFRTLTAAPISTANLYMDWSMDWPAEPSANPWRESRYQEARPRKFSQTAAWDHASPLEAIHDRDLNEMGGWFDRDDMTDVEADIHKLLVMLFPEPAWDDEAWAFLREHL
jgi:hypothetical protein